VRDEDLARVVHTVEDGLVEPGELGLSPLRPPGSRGSRRR
jgi:hypothetical protein